MVLCARVAWCNHALVELGCRPEGGIAVPGSRGHGRRRQGVVVGKRAISVDHWDVQVVHAIRDEWVLVRLSGFVRAAAFRLCSCIDPFKTGDKLYPPPDVQMLQACAQLFRHEGTFANYLGYVRTGCMLADVECEALDNRAVKRAKGSVKKSQQFQPRERMWIRRDPLEKLMIWGWANPSYGKFAKLWLFTHAFLLRLPSEALPAFAGPRDHQSSVFLEGDAILLGLRRRKNKAGGRLMRTCWCSEIRGPPCSLLWFPCNGCCLCLVRTGHVPSTPAG